MADDQKRVVWVLGAGFSAALGGPLLRNLFSAGSEIEIAARFPTTKKALLHEPDAGVARTPYREGKDRGLWSDAEQFLDYLDTASVERKLNPHRAVIERVLAGANPNVARLGVTARYLLAAECCGFLENVDVLREQWEPFVAWACKSLTSNDTVITFNYDLVVEKLAEQRDEFLRRVKRDVHSLKVLLPGHLDDANEWSGSVPLLKLHGSVDWCKHYGRKGGDMDIVRTEPFFALDGPPEDIAIATPGPTKRQEADGFKGLWDLAFDALKRADVIVFLGYRFPETDAYARATLLRAIGENGAKGNSETSKQLSLHVFLGNGDTSTPDAARLESL